MAKKKKITSPKVYSDGQKKAIVADVMSQEITTPYKSRRAIARQIGVNETTLRQWLKKSEEYQKFKEEQKVLIDSVGMKALKVGASRIANRIKTANLTQASIAWGILYDKIFGLGSTPLAQVNVGDKMIKVYYPNFQPPVEEAKIVKEKPKA